MILTRLEFDGIYGKVIADKVVFSDEEIVDSELAWLRIHLAAELWTL